VYVITEKTNPKLTQVVQFFSKANWNKESSSHFLPFMN